MTPTGRPAWSRAARIGHYDGAPDKEDSATEGATPYAWTWYQELGGMLGSAYSKTPTGHVHAKKLALARSFAAVQRAAEKLGTNSVPGTSDEALGQWVKVTGTHVSPDDTRHDIRQRAAARYLATRGPTWTNIDAAVEALLGPAFVRVWRIAGADMATPPTWTFWPGVNPGPSQFDLGGGTWMSERSRILVEINAPTDASDAAFQQLVNVELFRLLDEMLPAWATFDWAANLSTGFLLDISRMDIDALMP